LLVTAAGGGTIERREPLDFGGGTFAMIISLRLW
jgi:hypothetical protein